MAAQLLANSLAEAVKDIEQAAVVAPAPEVYEPIFWITIANAKGPLGGALIPIPGWVYNQIKGGVGLKTSCLEIKSSTLKDFQVGKIYSVAALKASGLVKETK